MYNLVKRQAEVEILPLAASEQLGSIYYDIAERFTNYAQELGVNPAALAISWVKSHPAVIAPIVGARNLAQLEDSLAAVEFLMKPNIMEEISKFSIQPGNATDRLEETFDLKYQLRNR